MSAPGAPGRAWRDHAASFELEDAARALRAGRVVAVPTDTVYGLAVDPTRPGATEALFALKGRPPDLALPVLVADADQAEALAGPDGLGLTARRLVARLWPGALTVVVTRRPGIGWDLGGDPATIGLRCPDRELVRRLCRSVGPLATTSANRHGQAPLTTAAAVSSCFGPGLPVIDGGTCEGAPSTVVDATAEQLRCLRPGAIPFEDVLAAAGGG